MGKKINDLLKKQRKKFKQQTGKIKGEENFKELKNASKFVNQLFFQHCKPGVPRNLKKWRTKGKQGIEGMFSKGLRSEYISRESLNEANEARKNEDINKIIDLGRIFQQKEERPRRCLKRMAVCTKKSPVCFGKVTGVYKEDTGQFPPSPISFAFTPEENCGWIMNSNTKKNVFEELDSPNEFAIFSSKYEESVGVQVLCKLPKSGVLEEAIEALKKVRMQKNELNEEFRENETKYEKEFKFLKHDFGTKNTAREDFFENFVSPEKSLLSKSLNKYEDFGRKPVENLLMTTDVELNNYNYNYPLFVPVLGSDDDNERLDPLMFQEKDFEKPTKDLNLITPPFHFYRRNMF